MDTNKLFFGPEDVQVIAQKIARSNQKACKNQHQFATLLNAEVQVKLNLMLQKHNSEMKGRLPERINEWIKTEVLWHAQARPRNLSGHLAQPINLLELYPPKKLTATQKNSLLSVAN